MRDNVKGITLVALVITIIILLILAGITISQLSGSGLFENAKLAKEKSENSQEKEETALADYENKIGEYLYGTRNSNLFKYSTEETKIGTWINGEELYQKVIVLNNLSTGYNHYTLTDYGIQNVKEVISVQGMTTRASGYMVPLEAHGNTWDIYFSAYLPSSNVLSLYLGTSYTGNDAIVKVNTIIQYTKN